MQWPSRRALLSAASGLLWFASGPEEPVLTQQSLSKAAVSSAFLNVPLFYDYIHYVLGTASGVPSRGVLRVKMLVRRENFVSGPWLIIINRIPNRCSSLRPKAPLCRYLAYGCLENLVYDK